MTAIKRILAVAVLVVPFSGAPALAAGGDSTSTEIKCTGGKVLDQKTKKCVDPQESRLDTESLYQAGSALAKAGRFGEAISVLSLAVDRGDPRVLNYLGYAHRMQGRVVVGLGYYQEALAIDPDFALAREYMGEAYLQMGDVASARGQLGEIARRCGADCEEYAQLAERIDAFEKG
ncbi:tetratricopeptide repeat protein [Nitratireductor soli]|uniref:tetratricopeptide repeat protein n=1 Tax=Nitratireductor soli TaxID=1670619 RepID=UPI00065DDF74|nr:tetratricopeptide repeat protein [Nitratireductor soli]